VLPGVAHEPSCGSASGPFVHVTRSGDVSVWTFPSSSFVAYAY
jgi:hypothetical protein